MCPVKIYQIFSLINIWFSLPTSQLHLFKNLFACRTIFQQVQKESYVCLITLDMTYAASEPNNADFK